MTLEKHTEVLKNNIRDTFSQTYINNPPELKYQKECDAIDFFIQLAEKLEEGKIAKDINV